MLVRRSDRKLKTARDSRIHIDLKHEVDSKRLKLRNEKKKKEKKEEKKEQAIVLF